MREMAFLEGDYLLVHLCFTISVNLKSFSGVALQGGRATVITIFFISTAVLRKIVIINWLMNFTEIKVFL